MPRVIRGARAALAMMAVACLLAPVAAARQVLGPGDWAPPIVARDLEGNRFKSDWAASRFTIVTFWGTWCEQCPDAMRTFEGLLQAHAANGVSVIALLYDPATDDEALRFATDLGVSYPLVRADLREMQRWGGVRVMPTTFLLDSEGKILRRYVGGQEMTEAVVADVNSIVDGGKLTTLKPSPLVIEPNIP